MNTFANLGPIEILDGRLLVVPGKITMQQMEILLIEHTLRANSWNKQKTADDLCISRTSLYSKIVKYKLVRPAILKPI